MIILFYISSLGGGGAQRVIVNLANAFVKLGHQSIVVSSFIRDNEYRLSDEVKRYSLDKENKGNSITRNFKLVKALRKIVKECHPDLLVSFMAEPNFRSILATTGLATRNIISVRNDPNREYSNSIYRLLAKLLYHKANGIVFQTQEQKEWFPLGIQKKGEIILNPVSDAFINSKGIPGSRKEVVSCGRLTKQKRYDLLIRAFKEVSVQYPDYTLKIYGEGEERNNLNLLIQQLSLQNKVSLMGQSNDIVSSIKNSSLFVMCSDYEGLPNALMEAMALGLPVISTDCKGGGARYLIGNSDRGFLINRDDYKVLANVMIDCLDKYEDSLVVGEKAARYIESYSENAIIGVWEKFCLRVANSN